MRPTSIQELHLLVLLRSSVLLISDRQLPRNEPREMRSPVIQGKASPKNYGMNNNMGPILLDLYLTRTRSQNSTGELWRRCNGPASAYGVLAQVRRRDSMEREYVP